MRVASLDLIRGVAVLGILAINVAGFAGPSIGALTPNLPTPTDAAGEAAFAFGFVVFQGKMRALFAILFGASMALYLDRAESCGRDGERQQAIRLAWLMLFGVLHYVLLWWGDILFAYAVCGLVLLLFHRLPSRLLAASALTLFLVLHLQGLLLSLPLAAVEEAVRLGQSGPQEAAVYARYRDRIDVAAAREWQQYTGGFLHILATKLRDHPFWLLQGVRDGFGEYLPLMILGLLLQRTGFFSGAWPSRRLLAAGLAPLFVGLTASLMALAWLWPRHFPVAAMDAALRYGLALPNALTAFGYAALLVLLTPHLTSTSFGRRLACAGRMAFSNYLGSSLLMTGIFYGWGLGLFGRIGPLEQWAFVLLGWAMILIWSARWLTFWKQGPLEWLWRSLTQGALLANRR
ncbi:DUF418 domain-containing protein [Novosphingobium sp. M1R2S20]|uniref:DUF418 domain-containing protein n=1 Tax=Novosphingobium rhizovicinum TaxID=3228928 RepID=A0ABV3R7Z7_9SPHN